MSDTHDKATEKLLEAAGRSGTGDVADAIKAGANVNAKEEVCGDTALHFAYVTGNLNVAEQLLEAGADPCIRNNSGETAIDTLIGQFENKKMSRDFLTSAIVSIAQARGKNVSPSQKFSSVINESHGEKPRELVGDSWRDAFVSQNVGAGFAASEKQGATTVEHVIASHHQDPRSK